MRLQPLTIAVLLFVAAAVAGCSKSQAPSTAPAGDQAAHQPTGESHESHGAEIEQRLLEPPEGQRWPTDEPLRAAMTRLRDAVEQNKSAHEQGALSAESATALADTVDTEVAYMVQNCKLDPQPDAALHVLLSRMLQAGGELRADPADASALPELVSVLRDYGATFDHPGWRSP